MICLLDFEHLVCAPHSTELWASRAPAAPAHDLIERDNKERPSLISVTDARKQVHKKTEVSCPYGGEPEAQLRAPANGITPGLGSSGAKV